MLYEDRFDRAESLAEKGGILVEYLELYPECAAESDWFKSWLKFSPYLRAECFEPRPEPRVAPEASEAPLAGHAERVANAKASQPRGLSKLPQKRVDLSNYLDPANLTERQRECISLSLEHSLPQSEIARRLGLHHSTVQEHIRAAARAIDRARGHEQRAKKLASQFPGSLRDE